MFKTIDCGELRRDHEGQEVTLAGWVDRRRDHGNLIFIDLRDRSGIVQAVFNPDLHPEPHDLAGQVRSEWVVQVSGNVTRRSDETINPNLPTGEIEVAVESMTVLNESKTPPFYVNEESDVDELLRLKYRYLDLRRPKMRDMLITRHKVVQFIREFLDERGFLEVETPILIKSTPEGARDFVVPSRLYPGQFYALPQSPQQLKQLLMGAGVEKYFQIARCFRDEDPRADRQVEHTQLDLEMSFVDQDDVLNLIEALYTALIEKLFPQRRLIKPFPRLTYAESMRDYASDKPDLRFGLRMVELSAAVANTNFRVFRSVLEAGGTVKGFAVPGLGSMPRRQLDDLVEFAKTRGAQGLVYIVLSGDAPSIDGLTDDHIKSPVAKFLSLDVMKEMAHKTGANPGDLLLMIAGPAKPTNVALDALRREMARRLDLADPDVLAFAFIVDFPLFDWNEDEGRWDAMHHAFSMPKPGDERYIESDPGRVTGQLYDLVCNGLELASGSIRIHTRDLQERVLKILGYTEEDIQQRFGQLIDSFQYGTPPHGGIAPGIDRLLMVLMDIDNIRDVIAFPKTQSGVDPLFGAPGPVEEGQLAELRIRVVE